MAGKRSLGNLWGEALGLLVAQRELLGLRTADTLRTPFLSTWPPDLQVKIV